MLSALTVGGTFLVYGICTATGGQWTQQNKNEIRNMPLISLFASPRVPRVRVVRACRRTQRSVRDLGACSDAKEIDDGCSSTTRTALGTAGLFVLFACPETSKLSLEETERIFEDVHRTWAEISQWRGWLRR